MSDKFHIELKNRSETLATNDTFMNVDKTWNTLKETIKTGVTNVPRKTAKRKEKTMVWWNLQRAVGKKQQAQQRYLGDHDHKEMYTQGNPPVDLLNKQKLNFTKRK